MQTEKVSEELRKLKIMYKSYNFKKKLDKIN